MTLKEILSSLAHAVGIGDDVKTAITELPELATANDVKQVADMLPDHVAVATTVSEVAHAMATLTTQDTHDALAAKVDDLAGDVATLKDGAANVDIRSTPTPPANSAERLFIRTVVLPDGVAGVAYRSDVTCSRLGAVFGTHGNMPPGLTLSNTGEITGTPTMDGSWMFEVVAEDAGAFAYATLTLAVKPAPANR